MNAIPNGWNDAKMPPEDFREVDVMLDNGKEEKGWYFRPIFYNTYPEGWRHFTLKGNMPFERHVICWRKREAAGG